MRSRWAIALASAAFLLALSWPAVAPQELDSLPLSNYPMFAHERGRVSRFEVAVWIDPAGTEVRLDPQQVGGTDQPMQAMMTVRQAIRSDGADVLCEEIASGFDDRGRIEVVSVRYDAVAWFQDDRRPIDRQVHASCPTGIEP